MKRLSIESRTKRVCNADGEDEISSPLLSLLARRHTGRSGCARSISRRDTILFSFTMVVKLRLSRQRADGCPDGEIGRRSGLKIRRSQGRGGSSPPPGTRKQMSSRRGGYSLDNDPFCFGGRFGGSCKISSMRSATSLRSAGIVAVSVHRELEGGMAESLLHELWMNPER